MNDQMQQGLIFLYERFRMASENAQYSEPTYLRTSWSYVESNLQRVLFEFGFYCGHIKTEDEFLKRLEEIYNGN